ncbi:MAG: ankyrin repeat domain-containing protein [Candidatus Berkiella sp.]
MLNSLSQLNQESIDFQFRKAANEGDFAKVQQLWSSDIVNIQGDSSGQTALHRAASQGHTNIVKWLLSKGADPRVPDFKGNTAFLLAAKHPATQAVLAQHPQAKLAEAWAEMHKHLMKTMRDMLSETGVCPPNYDPQADCLRVYKGVKKTVI